MINVWISRKYVNVVKTAFIALLLFMVTIYNNQFTLKTELAHILSYISNTFYIQINKLPYRHTCYLKQFNQTINLLLYTKTTSHVLSYIFKKIVLIYYWTKGFRHTMTSSRIFKLFLRVQLITVTDSWESHRWLINKHYEERREKVCEPFNVWT